MLLSEPRLVTYSLRKETILTLVKRYCRWNTIHNDHQNSFNLFFSTMKESILIFSRKDFSLKDFKCMIISILLPYLVLWIRLFTLK